MKLKEILRYLLIMIGTILILDIILILFMFMVDGPYLCYFEYICEPIEILKYYYDKFNIFALIK